MTGWVEFAPISKYRIADDISYMRKKYIPTRSFTCVVFLFGSDDALWPDIDRRARGAPPIVVNPEIYQLE